MNFPKPCQLEGRNIRTSHLCKSTIVGLPDRHLQYQEAERRKVSKGARRKPCCVLRNPHVLFNLFSGLFIGRMPHHLLQRPRPSDVEPLPGSTEKESLHSKQGW